MKSKELTPKLESDRLSLKKHSLDNSQVMFNHIDKDRERLSEFLPWVQFTKEVSDTESYIKDCHKKWQKHDFFDYGIFKGETYMGNIGVHSIDWGSNCCEIGYWIVGKFEGNGYISEAVRCLEKYLFEIGFHRIEIRCSSLNIKSSSVPIRCGYKLDGVLRDNAIDNGKYRNTQVYSKLALD